MFAAISYRLAQARHADLYCQALRDAAILPAIHYDLARARIADVYHQARRGHALMITGPDDAGEPAAQELLRSARNARRDLVTGYLRDLLDRPAAEFARSAAAQLAALRAAQVPYLFVAGNEIGPDYRKWLNHVLPQATVTVWPASGHFPHLAHPRRFAECLAATARWTTASRQLGHIGARTHPEPAP